MKEAIRTALFAIVLSCFAPLALADIQTVCAPGSLGGEICVTVDTAAPTIIVNYNGDQVDANANATLHPYPGVTLFVVSGSSYVSVQSAVLPSGLCVNIENSFTPPVGYCQ